MKKYFYKGRINNEIIEGYLDGESFQNIANVLENKKIKVLEIKEIDSGANSASYSAITKFTLKEKKEFFNSFYFQYGAGLPIMEVFDAINRSSVSKNIKALSHYISLKIKSGSSLAQALKLYSAELGETYCILLGAGEKTGKLQNILSGIIKNINQLEKIKANVIKKGTYPLIITCFAIAAALFMEFFVFKVFSIAMDETISVSGYVLLFLSALLKIAVIFLILTIAIVNVLKNKILMHKAANKFAKLFFIKPLIKNYYCYNFFYIFSLAFEAGLSTKEIINLSCDMVKLDEMQTGLDRLRYLIFDGCEITTAFNVSNVFSQDVISHLASGEKSGKLDESAKIIASEYQNNLNIQIDVLLKALEPFLMVGIGVLVAITLGRFYISYYSKLFSWL